MRAFDANCGTLNGKRLLSREQAIAAAVQNASMSRPEVSGALVVPQNRRAGQVMYHHCLTVLDAKTGMEIESALKP